MTRLSGYDLCACPSCGQVHRKTAYSSISVYISEDVSSSHNRTCAHCRCSFDADDFVRVGFVSLYTEEEKAERYAWVLYSFGQGPLPSTKPKKSFLTSIWKAIKNLIRRTPREPWMKYPPLKNLH